MYSDEIVRLKRPGSEDCGLHKQLSRACGFLGEFGQHRQRALTPNRWIFVHVEFVTFKKQSFNTAHAGTVSLSRDAFAMNVAHDCRVSLQVFKTSAQIVESWLRAASVGSGSEDMINNCIDC